jgi:ribosomal protein S18 acetylase RimI-like enzyme
MEDKRIRYWMKVELQPQKAPAVSGVRTVRTDDAEEIGHLMYLSYHGGIDDLDNTLEYALKEIKDTYDGVYGPFLDQCSFVMEDDSGVIKGVSLITVYEGKPLLAEIFVSPEAQGKGIGAALINASMNALAEKSYTELYLVVTEGNPAANLYKKLGFEKLGVAKPKTPPPPSP